MMVAIDYETAALCRNLIGILLDGANSLGADVDILESVYAELYDACELYLSIGQS